MLHQVMIRHMIKYNVKYYTCIHVGSQQNLLLKYIYYINLVVQEIMTLA